MEIKDFSHYQLRVNLNLLLRYEGLGPSITRTLRRIAPSSENETVVHVHFDTPVEESVLEGAAVYDMPGVVGLLDKEKGGSTTFHLKILENHLTNHDGEPLRRLDIHYDTHIRARGLK